MNDTNQVNGILEQLSRLNDNLAGAPSGVLVFLLVAALSFALRWWQLFPDKYVAPLSTLVGMVSFGLLTPYTQEHMRIWLAKSATLGFIISFLSSVAILKFGDRLPVIGSFLKPEPQSKPTEETKP